MFKLNRTGLVIAALSGSLLVSACGSSSSDSTGTGGVVGHAGSSGTAGKAGTATGGAVGTGGTIFSSGGAIGTAGASGGPGGAAGNTSAGGSDGGGGLGAGGATGGAGGDDGGLAGAAGGNTAAGGSTGAAGSAGAAAGGDTGAAGAGGSSAAGATGTAGAAGGAGGAAAGGAGGGAPVNPVVARGQYLVNSVLGCQGCHTPVGGMPLSGVDCFVKSGTQCLSSANLTNDASGLKNLSNQQIIDALTKGKNPNAAGKYLFARMPYYQFANLSSDDTDAVVTYLRTVPAVVHTVTPPTSPYDVPPSAPENAAADPASLPLASPAAGPTNGKYLATLTCLTCHTADLSGASPKALDVSKAFAGSKIVTTTINGTSTMVESANLTPDITGLMSWNASQVATAIISDKDRSSKTICGMRALPNMTTSDATDIGTYLLAIPPISNAITLTCP